MPDDALLIEVLHESHRFGALGETPEIAIQHSERFLAALGAASSVLDLGSGGGIPGLVLAARRPELRITLLDRRSARTDLLQRLVHRLDVGDRVTVLGGEAAVFGRQAQYQGVFDAVVCRSFGTPEITTRMSAPFLCDGGLLIVSEPPNSHERWMANQIFKDGFVTHDGPDGLKVLQRVFD